MVKADRITQDILDRVTRSITRGDAMSELDGKIKEGDAVKTLHYKVAVYGRVDFIDRKGFVYMKGRTQPGKPQTRHKVHPENLAKITEDELAPEDRVGGEGVITEVKPQTSEELGEQFEGAYQTRIKGVEIVDREGLQVGSVSIVDDKDLSPEELQRLQEDFRRRTSGDNRGTPVVERARALREDLHVPKE